MDLSVEALLSRYNREVAEQVHARILAEARAAAAEEALEQMKSEQETAK